MLIERADASEAQVAAFIAEHLVDMHAQSPACSVHALDTPQLQGANVQLWAVRDSDRVVGTVALQRLDDGHVELKSMRVDPTLRGTGIGRQLLEHALSAAVDEGATRVSLETGTQPAFAPARRLYVSRGFVETPPFGDYALDDNSVFMTLDLSAEDARRDAR